MSLNETELSLLKQTVDATNNNGVLYATAEQMANLTAQMLVEGNAAMVHPDNAAAYAFRARPEALVLLQNLAAAASPAPVEAPAVPVAPVAAPVAAPAVPAAGATPFRVVTGGFQLPVRGTRKPSNNGRTYPFESLEVGGAIFVPATDKRPDPKKSLASTISSANARFKEFSPRRYFKVVRAAAGQNFSSEIAPSDGAYIVRVEPPVEEAATA